MKKYLIAFIFFIQLCYYGNSQNLAATYSIQREFLNLPEDISIAPLELTGVYYKKNNRVISFQKADYLTKYPESPIVINDHLILIYTDSIQNLFAADLDSMILRNRFSAMPGQYENCFRNFELNYRKWEISNDSALINGLWAKRAVQYRKNGSKSAEIWFYEGIQMPVGICNLLNVPGLIVKAYFYGTHETYNLLSYSSGESIPDEVFWPDVFNEKFVIYPPLKNK